MPILFSLFSSAYFIHSYWNQRKIVLQRLKRWELGTQNFRELFVLDLGEDDAWYQTTSTVAITGEKRVQRRLKDPQRARKKIDQITESQKMFNRHMKRYGLLVLLSSGSLATFSVSILQIIFSPDGLQHYFSFGSLFMVFVVIFSLIPVKLNGTIFNRSLLYYYGKEVVVSIIMLMIILISLAALSP